MTDGQTPLSGFGGLGEIDEPRNIKVRQETSLERVLAFADAFIQEPIDEVMDYMDVDYFDEIFAEYSSRIYWQLSKQLADVRIDEKTIEDVVFCKFNSDYSEDKKVALGVFTGVLAQIVTEKNQSHGKRTRIYINGKGNKFDYLFFGANNVDEIFLQNLRGNDICRLIQNASRLVGADLRGDNIFNGCGGGVEEEKNKQVKELSGCDSDIKKGKDKQVKEIIVMGLKGDNNINYLRNVAYLTAIGINGRNNITVSTNDGNVERIVGISINNTYLLNIISSGSCAEIIFMGAGENTNMRSPVKTTKLVSYIDIPPVINAELCTIIYGSSSKEYEQSKRCIDADKFIYGCTEEHMHHNDCLNAGKLARHLKYKPQEEIVKIVDEVIRYVHELSSRLLMR